MSSAKNSNNAIVTNSNKRISAMKKYVTNAKTEIPIAGQVLKPAEVISVFQDDLDNRAAVVTTKAAYGAAVVARTESSQTCQVTDDALKAWVLNRFGATSAEAKEFGYAPRKKPTMSAQERAEAVEANQATRKARGTMPRKEKEKSRGRRSPPPRRRPRLPPRPRLLPPRALLLRRTARPPARPRRTESPGHTDPSVQNKSLRARV